MSPDLEAKLFADFPNLYSQGLLDGCFRCDDGWEPLIRELSARLEPIVAAQPRDDDFHMAADQVKEKFGGLRFYMTCSTEEVEEIIREYEGRSYKTCEVCGAPGMVKGIRGGRWVKAVCQEHTT